MFKKKRMLLIMVFAASLFFFVSAAAAFERNPTFPGSKSTNPGFQKQLRTPFAVSYAPQQFYIEYLFENPSGKGWWTGNALATIKVSRQDNSPTCRKYNMIVLTDILQGYSAYLPNVCSFEVEFTNIPVFREFRVRTACAQALPAPIRNTTTTWQEKIKIKAKYVKSTGQEGWEDVAVVPITANLRCESELKPHK